MLDREKRLNEVYEHVHRYQARNSSGDDLGTAVIHDAPFVRNRSTEYSGCLFSTGVTADLTLSTAWSDPHVGEF